LATSGDFNLAIDTVTLPGAAGMHGAAADSSGGVLTMPPGRSASLRFPFHAGS